MEKKQSTRVFVTGGTGFVGSYLLRYLLKEGYSDIRALRRKTSKPDLLDGIADKVEWVEGDVRDYESLELAMRGIDVVFHSAAVVSFDPRDKILMKKVNVEGTANVVNAALHNGVVKLIHVGSVAALGRSANQPRIDETLKWEPGPLNTLYGMSKFQAELEVWRGMEEGLPAVVVNPSVILGSGVWKQSGSSRIFHLIGKGLPFYPNGQNGFVDVRDVARFMIFCLEKDISGQRYILNGGNLSLQEMSASIARAMGRKPPRIRISPWIGEVAWRAEWVRAVFTGARPIITRETLLNARQKWEYVNDKSLELGFTYIPLQQTIEETARQWMESRGEKPAVLPV